MNNISTAWCVFDQDACKIVGIWNTYRDAYIFWNDALQADGTDYALFPAQEVPAVYAI